MQRKHVLHRSPCDVHPPMLPATLPYPAIPRNHFGLVDRAWCLSSEPRLAEMPPLFLLKTPDASDAGSLWPSLGKQMGVSAKNKEIPPNYDNLVGLCWPLLA